MRLLWRFRMEISTLVEPLTQLGGSTMTSIAVIIPCYNEELTISRVVAQFQSELPKAQIYVFDNNSTDGTVKEAREAGAQIAFERRQGKGYVVQRMFSDVNADVYVMVDGDGTYPSTEVHKLIAPILAGEADMVVGSRLTKESNSEFKALNHLGNWLFLKTINVIFGVRLSDILSGYRAFNREFVKNIPLLTGGFETETELTIKALGRGYRIAEVPVNLSARPEGSSSKIRLLHDGSMILNTILALFRDYKPLTFFGSFGLLAVGMGLFPGTIVIVEFIKTGLVPRLPSAVLAVGLVLSGLLCIGAGLVIHTITRRFQELEYALQRLIRETRSRSDVADGERDMHAE
jgi:glycosyltransferase involved in cell wall biosynthesis